MKRRASIAGVLFWTLCGTVCAAIVVTWVWGVVANYLVAPH